MLLTTKHSLYQSIQGISEYQIHQQALFFIDGFTYTDANCVGADADLTISKDVSNSEPAIGDLITYTITLENQSSDPATGVVVTDNLPSGVSYQANSVTTGSFAHSAGTGTWTVGTIAGNITETLTITVEVLESGIHFNEVEVTAANENDPDSTPNNGLNDEDDFADVCISVPEYLCDGSFTAAAEAGIDEYSMV